jgi:chromosome partitioning protein
MATIISSVNTKGGIGKTTTAFNVGKYFAEEGKKVLFVDLDAQGNLTTCLSAEKFEKTVFETFADKIPYIYEVQENIFLMPSDVKLAKLDLRIVSEFGRETILEKILKKISHEYDYIIIDCPYFVTLGTVNALLASDLLLIPTRTDYLTLEGLDLFLEILSDLEDQTDTKFTKYIIPTLYDKRNSLDKEILDLLRSKYHDVCNTVIRTNSKLKESPITRESIFKYAPNSNGSKDYKELITEVFGNGEI